MDEKTHVETLESQVAKLTKELARLKSAEENFNRQNESLKALHETSLGLLNTLDKDELLQNILEQAGTLSNAEHGYIYLRGPSKSRIQLQVGMGFFKSQLGRQVAIGEGMGGQVWRAEGPVVVDDYQKWPWRLSDKTLDSLRSIVGIPLKSGSEIQGVIGLAHIEEGKHFSQDDIVTLDRFAALALIAIEKAKLYAEVRWELTEREKTEAVLRESENRYRTFLECSPDPIVVYDMKGIATYVNPAFEQTFLLSREELLGKQIDFVPEESWPETREALHRMLSGQKIHLFETRRLTKDGRILDVQLSSTLYQGRDGTPIGNIVTLRDISEQKRTENELETYRGRLEEIVSERTAELAQANRMLELEVDERKRVEKELRRQEEELRAQSHHLEEVNTALKVLLKQREDDKRELEENVLKNVEELVTPYLHLVSSTRVSSKQKSLLNILETNLSNIISPFINKLTSGLGRLTPVEIRVASLVKAGKTNKEIADILAVSKNTVLYHRYNIRTKLGIKNKKINLQTHLLSIE